MPTQGEAAMDGIPMRTSLAEKEPERPSLQLQLTEQELEEEIPMILTAKNPVAPENVVRYNPNVKAFKAEAIISHSIVHYSTNGWLVSAGSDEANAQIEMEKAEAEAKQEYERMLAKKKAESTHDVVELKNVFNFAERAMQTKNHPLREREIQTDPPPVEVVAGDSSFSIIYDSYIEGQMRAFLADKMQKELRGKKGKGQKKQEAEEVDAELEAEHFEEPEVMESKEMKTAMHLMGRMISQNMFNHLILDFKYWEDQSDQFRQGEGTLLPLWHDPSFRNPSMKRKHVTALCWNPRHVDMFAVGYGSFDFHRQGKGDICIFSLKNPTEPEAVFECDSGAMCLDFHPEFPNLLAVGLYDGSVLVYDIATNRRKPVYQSNVRVGKHTDPVWQVRWQEDDMSKSLMFYSVSTDGRVAVWTVTKAEVEMSIAMELRLVTTGAEDDEEDTLVNALAGGCCFDFNDTQGHLFVVGTEEGLIHKCSKAYNSQYLDTYNAHHMPVYAVRWNHLHPRVFLSASADWTVKLWDHTSSERPFLSFDLGSPVGDAAWAPYSSTVFAAVTADGKVHVFDLAQNKNEPICEQKMPSKKAKLTRIAFNPKQPVLLVGDEKGRVTLLKLSPNLRKTASPVEGKSQQECEEAKMDRIIQIAEKSLKQALKAEKMREAEGSVNGADSEAGHNGYA